MNKRSKSQRLPATHVAMPEKISVIVLAAALAGCGGGDGSSATMPLLPSDGGASFTPSPLVPTPSAADPDAVVTTPTRTLDLRWGARASRYVLPTTDNVTARFVAQTGRYTFTGLFGQETITVPVGLDASTPLDKSTSLMQEVWITSDVKRAWSEGWTGAGVRIAVIDDFTPDQVSEFLTVPIPSGCNTVLGVTACPSATTAAFRMTHGDQVSAIAGGSLTGLPGLWVESGTYSAPLDLGFYSGVGDLSIQLSTPLFGVAKDAQVFRNDFLTYQRSTQGLFAEFKRWGETNDATGRLYRQIKVFNLSLGGTSRNPTQNTAAYQAQLAFANASQVPDAVFVKAVGNAGCRVSSTDCDPLNAVFYNATGFKDKSVLVGALDQAGGRIASYSNRAGNYADRFLVADGRGLLRPDGTYDQGTSFAAPRVAGYAAILRQKFPNLNATQTASVLLETAQWNSAWGERSASTLAIYGQGEAHLGRALAPVGLLR
jgi:subtilisin family serine protease